MPRRKRDSTANLAPTPLIWSFKYGKDKKIRQTIFCFAVATPTAWVFGYAEGLFGLLLQLCIIGIALHAVWAIWTDDTPWPEDEDEWAD